MDYFRECTELGHSTDLYDRYVFEFFNSHHEDKSKEPKRPLIFDNVNQESILNSKFVQSGMSVDTSFAPSQNCNGRTHYVCNKFFVGVFTGACVTGLDDSEVSVDVPCVLSVCHVVRRVAGGVTTVQLDVNQRRQEVIVRFDVERAILVANLVEMTAAFMQQKPFHVSIMGSYCELRF